MKPIVIFSFLILILWGCNGRNASKSANSNSTQKDIDTPILKDTGLTEADEPLTFKEQMATVLKSYSKIQKIDTLIIDGSDHLQVYMEYYCLHDSALTVPKRYMSAWGKENAKDFVTHNFATKILVLNNKDTIFNKVIKRNDFDSVIEDNLKKYAILFSASFNGYDKTKSDLVFGYTITIPMTDVGVTAALTINKHGNYKVWDEYANLHKKF